MKKGKKLWLLLLEQQKNDRHSLFFASLYRKIKYQNPSISEDFSKTFLKWSRDGLETTGRQCWSSGWKNVLRCLSFCTSLIAGLRQAFLFVDCVRLLLFVSVVLWEFWLRLNEIHEERTFAPCKAFLFVFVFVIVVVAFFSSLENYFGFTRTKSSKNGSFRQSEVEYDVSEHFQRGLYSSDNCAFDLWVDFVSSASLSFAGLNVK